MKGIRGERRCWERGEVGDIKEGREGERPLRGLKEVMCVRMQDIVLTTKRGRHLCEGTSFNRNILSRWVLIVVSTNHFAPKTEQKDIF